jgi:hypothetical protein
MKQEYLDVLWELQDHHALFAQFWAVGRLIESQAISTAAIAWNKEGGGLQFMINPEFWGRLTDRTKAFVIGHECLHAYLDHGRRSIGLDDTKANRAQDIVINHMLEDTFGFKREELILQDGTPVGEDWCWIDKCFPDRDDVEKDRCFEYYYGLLEEDEQSGGGGGSDGESGPQTVDSHEFMKDIDPETLEVIKDIVEGVSTRMTSDEIEDFSGNVEESNEDEAKKVEVNPQAGNIAGTMVKIVKLSKVVKKRKWETVVEDVLGRFAGMEREIDIEVWSRDPRRFNAITGDLMIPAEITDNVLVRDKIDVWFFQDTSGSCTEYAERFFLAAASIPEDRFRIRGFCFDTRTYEVDFRKGELQGFGGTAFGPIEERIQQVMAKEDCKYPQAVFIITDGYGTPVNPQHPERWHWFLTEPCTWYAAHPQDKFIAPESKSYELKDFE